MLEVEMALEVKITCREEDGSWSTRGQHVVAVFGTFRTQFERSCYSNSKPTIEPRKMLYFFDILITLYTTILLRYFRCRGGDVTYCETSTR